MKKLFGAELAADLERQLERNRQIISDRERRIENCETDYDDCFVSCRLDSLTESELKMKLEILKGDGCTEYEAVIDENGQEVGIHWFENKWRRMTCVGRGVFASSIEALCKKTGWTVQKIRVPVWVKYVCSGSGLAGAISGYNSYVRWHTNMVTGEYVGYPEYHKQENPRIAVEVLIGHGTCRIIAETSVNISKNQVEETVRRIAGDGVRQTSYLEVAQDKHLAHNQREGFKCGDNGIFKGAPLTIEQISLSKFARSLYERYPTDGKYILDGDKLIICQSNAKTKELKRLYPKAIINPLGDWTGGTDVDTGATNRKLGSDMADSITGGGLHGKDLTKADVSVNIYAFLKAQETHHNTYLCCAIGDDTIDGRPYSEIVEIARKYIHSVGGFERFAEWGLF